MGLRHNSTKICRHNSSEGDGRAEVARVAPVCGDSEKVGTGNCCLSVLRLLG